MNSRRVILAWDSYEGFMYKQFAWMATKFGGLMMAVGFIIGRAMP